MKVVKPVVLTSLMLASLMLTVFVTTASAIVIKKESVTGGVLQNSWLPGFGVQNNATAVRSFSRIWIHSTPSERFRAMAFRSAPGASLLRSVI